MAVLLRVRHERDDDCGAQCYRVATEASHFIQSLGRRGRTLGTPDYSYLLKRLREAMEAGPSIIEQVILEFRAEGLGQALIYELLSDALGRLAADDPRYDAIADLMDRVWGGPWAKGRAFFDAELRTDRLRGV